MRSGEREPTSAGAAEGLLAVLTPMILAPATEAERPRARAARLHDQIEAGATSIAIFGAHELAGTVTLRLSDPDEVPGDDPRAPTLVFDRQAPMLERRDPSTIPRFVRTVIVDTVDLVPPRRLASHIREEVAVAVPPPFANGDAAPAIALPTLIVRVEAT